MDLEKYFNSLEYLQSVVKTLSQLQTETERLIRFEQAELFSWLYGEKYFDTDELGHMLYFDSNERFQATRKYYMSGKEYDKELNHYNCVKGELIGYYLERLINIKISSYDEVLNSSIVHLYDNEYEMCLPELN